MRSSDRFRHTVRLKASMESMAFHSSPAVPYFYQCVLHDVLGFRSVERDTECEPEKFVLQRQHIVTETDFLHLLSVYMTIMDGDKLQGADGKADV